MATTAPARSDQAPPTSRLEIRKSPDAALEVGGLRFVACRREVDVIDGGITLYVNRAAPGDARELLRFDLFRHRPHYHAPAENQQETKIDASGSASVVEWGVEQLTRRAVDFVVEAGFGELAPELDRRALADAAPALRALLAGLAEPTELSHFEIPTAQFEALRRPPS